MDIREKSRSFLQKLLQNPPELPFEPTLLAQLFAVTREDSAACTDDLVALIERSQKLATRVLAIANSAAYGLEYKVSTLPRAVSILGFSEVRLLVVMAGMASMIKEVKIPTTCSIATLWKHQLEVAAIAKALAAELGGPLGPCGPSADADRRLEMTPDEAYAAGLLHDIGKVFLVASRPDVWAELEEIRQNSPKRSFEVEIEYWGIDHALIGAEVLHAWKLPLLLTEPINWHHEPELATAHRMDARLLAAANHLAHAGFDLDNGLCAEASSLLPKGSDHTALGAAIGQSLAQTSVTALVTLFK